MMHLTVVWRGILEGTHIGKPKGGAKKKIKTVDMIIIVREGILLGGGAEKICPENNKFP